MRYADAAVGQFVLLQPASFLELWRNRRFMTQLLDTARELFARSGKYAHVSRALDQWYGQAR